MTDIRSTVRRLIAEGWHVVPIDKGSKAPSAPNWQKTEFTETDFKPDDNVGAKLGHGRVDVDHDCPEAVIASKSLLLETGRIHGRASAGQAHHWFQGDGLKPEQFKDIDGKVLVEIRSGQNQQTVIPPSVHPSGEDLVWYAEREPSKVDPEGLRSSVLTVAIAALLARHWPTGSRHKAACDAAGFLVAQKLEPAMVERIIGVAARIAKDEEVNDRTKAARDTADQFAKGGKTTGGPTLAQSLTDGKKVVERLRQWFGLDANEEALGHIEELNKVHAIVRAGESSVVIDERVPERILLITFPEFKKLYIKKKVIVGRSRTGVPVVKGLADFWLEHPAGREHGFLEIAPPPLVLSDSKGYNLWKGFRVEPKAGDWSRMREHIEDVICDGDTENVRYVLNWCAGLVQQPGVVPGCALTMKGGRGVGKGMVAQALGECFHRRHYAHISSRRHVTGNFNALLEGKVLVFADEAVWGGDKTEESVLKTLITEKTITIEHKGVNPYEARNLTHLIMASNNDWAIPAGADERRFLVMNVSDRYQDDDAYFEALAAETANGGREAMLYDLLRHSLNLSMLRRPRNTEGLWHQKLQSMSAFDRWLFGYLDRAAWKPITPCVDVFADYVRTLSDAGVQRRAMETEFGMALNKILGPALARRQRRVNGARTWIYEMPALDVARASFMRHYKLKTWPGSSEPENGDLPLDVSTVTDCL